MDIPTKPKRQSKNYRVSPETIRLLSEIAKIKNTTVSDVLDNIVLLAAPKILEGLERDTNKRRRVN